MEVIATQALQEPAQLELSLPARPLLLQDLSFLEELGHVQGDVLVLTRSPKGYTLKGPVGISLERLLAVGEKGLLEYIVNSLLSQRPRLIPWVLDNQTVLNLARYMLRSWSGSPMGLYGYTNTVSLYCRRLNTGPDLIIADCKPDAKHVDQDRVAKHKSFLSQCVAELQDSRRSVGRIHGYVRHIRTFYRVNGVDLPKLELPRDRVENNDRAPRPDELQRLLDIADLRERVIVTMLALGGFREGTLAHLRYGHISQELEKGIVPLHVHVDSEITKGKYHSYDTFLAQEAVECLRLHFEQRRRGTLPQHRRGKSEYIPPEKISDDSPLIRDVNSAVARPIGEKQIYKIVHRLYYRAGLLRTNAKGRYDLRAHSLRKYFKTQLKARGVESDYVDFWLGHTIDRYHDVQSKGIEFLRNVYAQADLRIRPASKPNETLIAKRVLKQLIRGFGQDSARTLFEEALSEPQMAYVDAHDGDEHEIQRLAAQLVQRIREARNNPRFPGPPEFQR